jgi:hypothetical protein
MCYNINKLQVEKPLIRKDGSTSMFEYALNRALTDAEIEAVVGPLKRPQWIVGRGLPGTNRYRYLIDAGRCPVRDLVAVPNDGARVHQIVRFAAQQFPAFRKANLHPVTPTASNRS